MSNQHILLRCIHADPVVPAFNSDYLRWTVYAPHDITNSDYKSAAGGELILETGWLFVIPDGCSYNITPAGIGKTLGLEGSFGVAVNGNVNITLRYIHPWDVIKKGDVLAHFNVLSPEEIKFAICATNSNGRTTFTRLV